MIDGDITTHAQQQDLGAFRFNYESGTNAGSLQYPMLFGLGNHDINTNVNSSNDAHRLFDYLQQRMANTHMSASGNYSWDWNGVHMVQLNTWAGDQMSYFSHPEGLSWLKADLAQYVGNSTTPVLIFQHYRLQDVGTAQSTLSSGNTVQGSWWPSDAAATDRNGNLTGVGYESFFNVVKNYNVIGMFSGHDHCLGVSSTDGFSSNAGPTAGNYSTAVDLGGSVFPGIPGYGQPIDNYDDGAGGAQGTANGGNHCTLPTQQEGVGNFLVTHLNQHYLDVAAVSWTGDGSTAYFDSTIGFPGASAACRKRINSQFIPVGTSIATVSPQGNSYQVTNSTGQTIDVPLALQFPAASAPAAYDFVDRCGDSSHNAYLLVNGENSLGANQTETLTLPYSVGSGKPTLVALTPLSGLSQATFLHTTAYAAGNMTAIAPANDSFTVYGPANQPFTVSAPIYQTSITGWLEPTPSAGNFDALGRATVTLTYLQDELQETQEANAIASVNIQTSGVGTVQTVFTEVDFRAPVTMTLTANPPHNGAVGCDPSVLATQPGCEPEFIGQATYTHISPDGLNDGAVDISGVLNLYNVDPVTGVKTSISTAIVNTNDECFVNGTDYSNPQAEGEVVFGSPANNDNICPSYGPSSTPGQIDSAQRFVSANMTPGIYHLVVAYLGSGVAGNGQGDGLYAPAISSPPLLYRIGDAPSSVSAYAGDGQTTPAGEYFNNQVAVKVWTNTLLAGGPANAIVTFTVVPGSTGASGSFDGSSAVVVYADAHGIATAPPILANAIQGTWQISAAVTGIDAPVVFTMTNSAPTLPNLQLVVTGKSGTLPNRTWTVELVNAGGTAAGLATLQSLTFQQKSGPACTPAATSLPYTDPLLSALPGQNTVSFPVAISFPSCSQLSKFTVTANVLINSGQVNQQIVLANQFP